MLGFSWAELGVVLLVALLVLKPEDLPDIIRKMAKFVRGAKSMADEVTAPIREIVRETEQVARIKGDDGNWYETYAPEKIKENAPPLRGSGDLQAQAKQVSWGDNNLTKIPPTESLRSSTPPQGGSESVI
jgi:Tat protein translocase TatB subunit